MLVLVTKTTNLYCFG